MAGHRDKSLAQVFVPILWDCGPFTGSTAQVRSDMNRALSGDCFFGCDAFSTTHSQNLIK
jgi:hypothetical protein